MQFNINNTITEKQFEAISFDLNNLLFYIDTESDDNAKESYLALAVDTLKALGDIIRKKATITMYQENIIKNLNTLVSYVGGAVVIDSFIARKSDKEFVVWLEGFFNRFLAV